MYYFIAVDGFFSIFMVFFFKYVFNNLILFPIYRNGFPEKDLQ